MPAVPLCGNFGEPVFQEALGFMSVFLRGFELRSGADVAGRFALFFSMRVIRDVPKGAARTLVNPALSASVQGITPPRTVSGIRKRSIPSPLRRLGWGVCVIWQCELNQPSKVLNRLSRFLGPLPTNKHH